MCAAPLGRAGWVDERKMVGERDGRGRDERRARSWRRFERHLRFLLRRSMGLGITELDEVLCRI